MPSHLRPPERRMAHPIGVLAIALGISLIVIAGFSSRPSHEGTANRLIQPATETSETVLGEVIERTTTLPEAPPASALGFTTTSTPSESPTVNPSRTPPPTSTPPTIAPPVSVTAPPTTTTTTEPPFPACSDGLENDGDGAIDSLDPGCHSDGDAGNPDSYVPGDDDETG